MTVPIEFLATGRPSSVNGTTAKKNVWKQIVNSVAHAELLRTHSPNAVPAAYAAEVTVKVFYFPTNRQHVDVDNGLKHTIDAISPPILKNDKLVQRLITERILPVAGTSVKAPIAVAPMLARGFDIANGRLHGVKAVHTTAVRVEMYVANGGALW